MELVGFAQAAMTILLFFAVAPLMATLREFREWMVLRGTWIGILMQILTTAGVAIIVVFNKSPYSQETLAWVLVLTLCNMAWFVLVRLVRLVRDHC